LIPHEIISTFSSLWWDATIVSCFIIFVFINIGANLPTGKKFFLGKAIGFILFVNFICFHLYQLYFGIWSASYSLPLHLCGLSSILSFLIFFFRKQWLYELLFYWGIPGAFHSLMTPEFTLGKDGFLFYEYYVSHGGILLSALYCTFVLSFKPRLGSWWKVFLLSQSLILIVGMLNWLLDANYMYFSQKPIVDNPFLIGEWPWYIFFIDLFAMVHFLLIYIPFKIKFYNNKLSEA